MEVRVRNTVKWVALAAVVVSLVAACRTTPRIATRRGDKIRIKADCVAPNQVTVDVDNWVASADKGGDIDWIKTGGNALVTIEPKIRQLRDWPFANTTDIIPTSNGAKTTVRPDAGNPDGTPKKYRYVIRIVCGGTNPQTVVIDPDIIVN